MKAFLSFLLGISFLFADSLKSQCSFDIELISTQPSTTCTGDGSVAIQSLFAQAPITYVFNGDTIVTNSGIFDNMAPGPYFLNAYDAAGCTDSLSFFIDGPAPIDLQITGDLEVGCGETGNLTAVASGGAGGNYTYTWSTGETTATITNLPAGTYLLTVTDPTDCAAQGSASIVASDTLGQLVVIDSVQNFNCDQTTGVIFGSYPAGTEFEYFNVNLSPTMGTLLFSTDSTFEIALNYPLGSVIEWGTTGDSPCFGGTDYEAVDENDALQVSLVAPTTIACLGDDPYEVTVNVSQGTAPFTYAWAGFPDQTGNTLLATGTGQYIVTVTDATGCSAVRQVGVSDFQLPLPFLLFQDTEPVFACLDGVGKTYWRIPTGVTIGELTYTGNATGTAYQLNDSTLVVEANAGGNHSFFVEYLDPDGAVCRAGNRNFQLPAVGLPFPVLSDSLLFVGCTDPTATITLTYPAIVDSVVMTAAAPSGEIHLPFTTSDSTQVFLFDEIGLYFIQLEYLTADGLICQQTGYVVEVILDGADCATLNGYVRYDPEDDCSHDSSEPPLVGRLIRASGGGMDRFAVTDSDGYYEMFHLPGQSVEVEIVSDHNLYENCPLVSTTLGASGSVTQLNLSQTATAQCVLLDVEMTTPQPIRCFDVTHYIDYCNIGTQIADAASIEVQFDPLYTILETTLPFTDLGNNLIRFELGEVQLGACGEIWVTTNLSCNAQLNQTLCNEANIFPDDPCPPASPQWSGATVEVTGTCEDGENQFLIKNIGTAAMQDAQSYIVIEDGVVLMQDPQPFLLAPGDSVPVVYPGNGSTYRLEAMQEVFHPGDSLVAATIEGCVTGGNDDFSTGFVLQFPLYDNEPTEDIDCHVVIGAYDPNDKQGFPVGYGDEHFLEPDTPLEYLIRFQNTGTDTARTVRVEDVIHPDLDLTTFRPLGSSHDYELKILGDDTLNFVFDQIMLVDSFTNEPLSHGFIRFAINMKPGLPLGTVLTNQAAIYFDFNEPIITNEVFYTLGREFVTITSTAEVLYEGLHFRSYPQPTSGAWNVELTDWTEPVRLEVFDLRGRHVFVERFVNGQISTYLDLKTGLYAYRILAMDGRPLVVGKIVVE